MPHNTSQSSPITSTLVALPLRLRPCSLLLHVEIPLPALSHLHRLGSLRPAGFFVLRRCSARHPLDEYHATADSTHLACLACFFVFRGVVGLGVGYWGLTLGDFLSAARFGLMFGGGEEGDFELCSRGGTRSWGCDECGIRG